MLNQHYLSIFFEVAKTGNLTQAAENLNMAPPSVSRFINLLEEESKCKLFNRSRTGMALTEKGQILYNYVFRSQNLISQAESALGLYNTDPKKTLSIGFANMLFEPFILPGISYINEKMPDLNIRFTSVLHSSVIPKLQNKEVNFVIHTDLFEQFPKVSTVNVGKISNTVCAPSSFTHLKGRKVSLKELVNESVAILGNTTAGSEFYQRFLLSNNIILKPKYSLSTYTYIKGILSQDLAVCIGPKLIMKEVIERGQAFEVDLVEKIPDMDVSCYLNTEVKLEEPAKLTLDYFINHKIHD